MASNATKTLGRAGIMALSLAIAATPATLPLSASAQEQAQTQTQTQTGPASVADLAERLGVGKRLDARQGSWFDPLQVGEDFDVIVSNPPYVNRAAIATLAREVKDHDPPAALDGGPDGLDAYRAILAQAGRWLRSGGAVIVEIGADQGDAVRSLFRQAGLLDVTTEKDLAGLDRMVVGHHS